MIAGDGQPPLVHALAQVMNDALGNVGQTVRYIDPVASRPSNSISDLATLTQDMAAGDVELLLVLGGNPVFSAPADLDFARHLQKVSLRVHWGLYADETAGLCDWHIPAAHFLESWSDGRTFDGTASIIQPLIAPLYDGHSAHEVLSALFEEAARPGHEIVHGYWRENWPAKVNDDEFDRQWETALREGVIANTAFAPNKG